MRDVRLSLMQMQERKQCSSIFFWPAGNDVAMTGEISLRGLVLPVGGIKEKVVAAARTDITRVMLPARNRKDFQIAAWAAA